jgi:hypothetical protein
MTCSYTNRYHVFHGSLYTIAKSFSAIPPTETHFNSTKQRKNQFAGALDYRNHPPRLSTYGKYGSLIDINRPMPLDSDTSLFKF